MKISAIVAMSRNRVIGKNNALPWHLPEDLKRFRSVTQGNSIIMGRKTFESIGRVLPGRENIIVSRQADYRVVGAVVVPSLNDALVHCEKGFQSRGIEGEAFIIGGAEIYKLALPKVNRIYLTLIQKEVEGDTLFPPLSWEDFIEVSREDQMQPLPHSYVVLDRR